MPVECSAGLEQEGVFPKTIYLAKRLLIKVAILKTCSTIQNRLETVVEATSYFFE